MIQKIVPVCIASSSGLTTFSLMMNRLTIMILSLVNSALRAYIARKVQYPHESIYKTLLKILAVTEEKLSA
jgi:hypothetical protein